MDHRVSKLSSPEDCEKFSKNAKERNRPDLALEATRRAVELRAAKHGAQSEVEREALKAVYAYQEVLSRKNGKRTRASRTWQMIERRGILGAVETVVSRDSDSMGYTLLAEMGMRDLAFEAVVLRYPNYFSAEAIQRSKQRLVDWGDGGDGKPSHS